MKAAAVGCLVLIGLAGSAADAQTPRSDSPIESAGRPEHRSKPQSAPTRVERDRERERERHKNSNTRSARPPSSGVQVQRPPHVQRDFERHPERQTNSNASKSPYPERASERYRQRRDDFDTDSRPASRSSDAVTSTPARQQNVREVEVSSAVTCRATPVCANPARGSCRAVEWTYTSPDAFSHGRRDIARLCELANTPDSCGCTAQCTSTARCSR